MIDDYKKILLSSIPNFDNDTTDTRDGLYFKSTILTNDPIFINIKKDNYNHLHDLELINENKTNPVIKDIGKPVTLEMGCCERIPIRIDTWEPDIGLHQYLTAILGNNRGLLDLWIKKENCDTIIIPKELQPIKKLLQRITEFELNSNPDFAKWNMWLLLDIKNVDQGFTQRNAGFHYDGLNISGKYKNRPLVSIYIWYNILGTVFYTGTTSLPNNLNVTKYNMSSFAQRQIKHQDNLVIFPNYSIIKTDGASVHSCQVSMNKNINDRIFIRICFTPPGMIFNRLGNTVNPCLSYPETFKWYQISEPSVKLLNCTLFSCAREFKNMWDVACIGHPSFAMAITGRKSSQFQLIHKLKKSRNILFIKEIVLLYNKEIDIYERNNLHMMKNISEWRKEILIRNIMI